MAVTETTIKIRNNGDGAKVRFDFPFKYFEDTDLKVYKIDTSVSPEDAGDPLILGTDYSVERSNTGEGGTIVYTVAPLATEDSFIKLDLEFSNDIDIPTGGVFREFAIENAKDINTLLCQQLNELISRSFVLEETSSVDGIIVETPVDGRGVVWFFNSGTGKFELRNTTSDLADLIPDAEAAADAAAASAAAAAVSEANAAQSAQDAADSAASINLPTIQAGDAGKGVKVNGAEDGYEFAEFVEVGDLPTSKCRAYRDTSVQTILTATATKVEFNAESYDVGNDFDPVTDFDFTVPEDGYYEVYSNVAITLDDTNRAELFIRKNGVTVSENNQLWSTTLEASVMVQDILSLSQGDVITVFIQHDRGANADVSIGEGKTFLTVRKLV